MPPFSLPDEFVQGVVGYSDYDPTQPYSRIIIPVSFGNSPPTPAVVDTGAPWCILGPEEAEGLEIGTFEFLESPSLTIREVTYSGRLYRMSVSLEAAEGVGLSVEAKVLILDLEQGQVYSFPNFVGFEGFLELIRFAVDPGQNLFYFGSLA